MYHLMTRNDIIDKDEKSYLWITYYNAWQKKYQPFKDIDMDIDCTESKKGKFNPFKINHNVVLVLTVLLCGFFSSNTSRIIQLYNETGKCGRVNLTNTDIYYSHYIMQLKYCLQKGKSRLLHQSVQE